MGLVAATVMMMAAAPASVQHRPVTTPLTQADADRVIPVARGGAITIVLPVQRGTGYGWRVASLHGMAQQGPVEVPAADTAPTPGFVGGPATAVIRLRAAARGAASATLTLDRAGAGRPASRTLTYRFRVR